MDIKKDSQGGGFLRAEVLFLFLINFGIGLFFLNEGLFHFDSVVLAQAVETTYRTGQLQTAACGRYGAVLINSILYFPFFLLGYNADFLTRFSSILFHSLSIVAFFFFILDFVGDRVCAFFGALLFSFAAFYFIPNTYGKEHGMAMFFLLLSFFLLSRGGRRASPLQVGLASFFYAFSISVREAMIVMIPLYCLLYFHPDIAWRPFRISIGKERLASKSLISFSLPFLFVFGFCFFTYLEPVLQRTMFSHGTHIASLQVLPLSSLIKEVLPDFSYSVDTYLLILFIIGLIRIFRDESIFVHCFLLLWLALIFVYGNCSMYTPRYLDVVIIPFYVIVAYAIAWVYRLNRAVAIVVVISLVLKMFIFMYPLLEFRHHYNGEKRFAQYVRSVTENNSVIIAADDAVFLTYYGHCSILPAPTGDTSDMHAFVGRIRENLRQGKAVYMIGSATSYDQKGLLRQALMRNFDISLRGGLLAEDFHRSELKFQIYYENLYKLTLKKD